MIELIAVMCALSAPCKDVSMVYNSDPQQGGVTVMQCMVGAQPELAKWAESHPGYYVKHWSCGAAGRFAKV